jgi:hypothetical protein
MAKPHTFAYVHKYGRGLLVPVLHHEVGVHPHAKAAVEKHSPREEACRLPSMMTKATIMETMVLRKKFYEAEECTLSPKH